MMPEEESENLSSQFSELEKEWVRERTYYLIRLYRDLRRLKAGALEFISKYRENGKCREELSVLFTTLGVSDHVFSLFESLFDTLYANPLYYGDEFRKIKDIKLEGIGGISIEALGIDAVVRKCAYNENEDIVIASLEDLDGVRMGEMRDILGMTNGNNGTSSVVLDIFGNLGGIKFDPLFSESNLSD